MAREYPHLITAENLLAFTGKQAENREILAKLERHERAVKRLRKAGLEWDADTGKIKPRK